MAAAGLAKLGIRFIILLQFLIGNLGSKCTDIDLNNFSPCDYGTVLISSQGPCNVLIPNYEDASNSPTVKLEIAEESKNYLLLMLDPDAPDPELAEYKFWIHWIVYNIEGSSLRNGIIKGEDIFKYTKPDPPTGLHRYQFFVFEQLSTLDRGSIIISTDTRQNFNLDDFASKNNLCNNLKGSYQFYATKLYKLTGAVLMVSGGKHTMLLGAITSPLHSGSGGSDASAPEDSSTVKPADKATEKGKDSGLQSFFLSRDDKIKFLLISFCASYAFKPSC